MSTTRDNKPKSADAADPSAMLHNIPLGVSARISTQVMADTLVFPQPLLPHHRLLLKHITHVADDADGDVVSSLLEVIQAGVGSTASTALRVHTKLAAWKEKPLHQEWQGCCCSLWDVRRQGLNLTNGGTLAIVCSCEPYNMWLNKHYRDALLTMTPERQEEERRAYNEQFGSQWHAAAVHIARHPDTKKRRMVVFDPSDRALPADTERIRFRDRVGLSMVEGLVTKVLARYKEDPHEIFLVHYPNPDASCLSMCMLWIYYVACLIERSETYDPTKERYGCVHLRR